MLHGNWYRRKEDRKHYKNIRTCIVLDRVLSKGLIEKISDVNYQMVYSVRECSGSEGVSKSPGGWSRRRRMPEDGQIRMRRKSCRPLIFKVEFSH